MKYCPNCGSPVALRIPEGDDRKRHVCDQCDTVHYQNPRIITGCLPVYGDKVLLCRRAIEPRYGFWTLPAGFMENGETVEQGALRESWEEARARIDIDALYTLFNLPQINQVYMFYRGNLANPDFAPGTESLDVELFAEEQIPWEELAFPVVVKTLRHYFSDRKINQFPFRCEDIYKPPGRDSKSQATDTTPEIPYK